MFDKSHEIGMLTNDIVRYAKRMDGLNMVTRKIVQLSGIQVLSISSTSLLILKVFENFHRERRHHREGY